MATLTVGGNNLLGEYCGCEMPSFGQSFGRGTEVRMQLQNNLYSVQVTAGSASNVGFGRATSFG